MNSFDPTKNKDTATPKKSRSITFRLDMITLDELQKEADLKELSLNVLVNQVLRRYVEWDRYESKLGMMPVPKLMLATLIDETVQVAVDAGISGIDSSRDRILNYAAKNCVQPNEGFRVVYEEEPIICGPYLKYYRSI